MVQLEERGRIQGDIRDLYSYYRFSDYNQVSITLKNKSLAKEDVWFEGFMDWTFLKCTFSKSFYFGVDGAKLPEDPRVTGKSEEPFPPYGSNSITFVECTFSEYFEIKDNCVVIFRDCEFEEAFTIEDNCKVEFLACTFKKGLTLKTFCNIRFLRCNLDQDDFGFSVEDHCELFFNNCVQGTAPSTYFLSMTSDCKAIFHTKEKTNLNAEHQIFELHERSHVKIYNYGTIQSVIRPMADVNSHSKFEAYDASQLLSANSDILSAIDSEIFMKNVESCGCPKGRAIYAERSLVRSVDVDIIKAQIENGIEAIDDSEVSILNTSIIQSAQGYAIYGDNSRISVSNVSTMIQSAQKVAIYLTESSRGIFRNVELIESGVDIAVWIDTNAWGSFFDVPVIISGTTTAIKVTNGGRYTDEIGDRRQGMQYALEADNAKIEIENVTELNSSELDAVKIVSSMYDLRDISLIVGKFKAFEVTNSQGIATDIGTIRGEIEQAVIMTDCSGPVEWDQITLIESELETAMEVSGALYGLRICGVETIRSPQKIALKWNQTSGDTFIYDIGTIEAQQDDAMQLTVTGRFRAEKVDTITTEQGDVLEITTQEGNVEMVDITTMTTQQGDVVKMASDVGDLIRLNKIQTMTTQQGDVFKGTSCKGQTLVANVDTATTQQGDIVTINCGNEPSSFVRFVDVGTMSTMTSTGDAVKVEACASIQLHRVDTISAQTAAGYIVSLNGLGAGFGRAEIIDCPSITAMTSQGGVAFEDIGAGFLVGGTQMGSLTAQTCNGDVLHVASASLEVKNYTAIEATAGTGYGVFFDAPEGQHLLLANVTSIKHEKGAKFTGAGSVKVVKVPTIEAVKEDGIEVSDNMEIHILSDLTIKTPSSTKKALSLSQTRRHNLISKLTVPLGMFYATEAHFSLSDITFMNGDFYASQSTGNIAKSTWLTAAITLEEANLRFQDITVFGAGNFNTDINSTLTLDKGYISDGGEFICDGVVYANNVTYTKKITGANDSGVLLGNRVVAREVDGGATLVFNEVVVTHTFTPNRAVSVNSGEFYKAITINDGTGIFFNDVTIRTDGIDVVANHVGLFANRLEILQGSIASADSCGLLFNKLNVLDGYESSGSRCGIIINQGYIDDYLNTENASGILANAVVVKGDLFPLGTAQTGLNGVILNRVTFDETGAFNVGVGTGVLASWVKGGDLSYVAADGNEFDPYVDPAGGGWVNGISGMISAYSQFKGDMALAKGNGLIMTANTSEGNFTINEGCGVIDVQGLHYEDATGAGGAISIGTHLITAVPNISLRTLIGARLYDTEGGTRYDQILLDTTYTKGEFGTGTDNRDVIVTTSGGKIKRSPSSANWDV